ncbi:hypothetical protein AJ80_08123 [Polytolypa hystricis UAMH7299]|uniref:SH3 domain-containing protein n=1 Tax=Polytolypa hystricis (strain UAMH7299) TaxID=1447883 RepID=A0A2B7XC51_POLH7|nr:hypothetical protein AJ80_08123 [Polytolypa hystricis UAMH7299]
MAHQHRHARRKHIAARQSISDNVKEGIRELFGREPKGDDDVTVVSVVYVTADKTFDGPIGGYKTEGAVQPNIGKPIEVTQTKAAPVITKTQPKPTPKEETTTSESKPTPKNKAPTTLAVTTSTPSALTSSEEVRSLPTDIASTTTSSPTALDKALDSSSSATAVAASGSDGLSAGAKAGVAIGIIALVGLLAAGILLFVRKKKRGQALEEPPNEKPYAGTGAAAPPPSQPPMRTVTATTPPQLNIRPITQFSPDLGGNSASSGNLLGAGFAAGAASQRDLTGHQDNSSPKSNPFNDPVNPFESHAITTGQSPPSTPAGLDVPQPLRVRTPSPETASIRTVTPETGVAATAVAVAAGAGAIGAVAAVHGASSGKAPTLQTVPGPPGGFMKDPAPSPAMSVDSISVASTGAAAAAIGPGPGNVHRIQLDFIPTMDDELELRAGQLVRLIHEYDDGWALCMRLDRSQQGVAPRTCLSARPVKPRPRGPPQGPGPRGPPPPGGPPGRPMSPAGRMPPGPAPHPNGPPRFPPPQNGPPSSPSTGYRPYPAGNQDRPMSPVRFPQVPRSLSPGPGGRIPQPRSMSPGPYGAGGMEKPIIPEAQRARSNSASGVSDRFYQKGPAGPSGLKEPVFQAYAPAPAPAPAPAQAPAHTPAPAPVSEPRPNPPTPVKSPPLSLGPVERKPLPGHAQ